MEHKSPDCLSVGCAVHPRASGTDTGSVPASDRKAGKGPGEKQKNQQRCHLDHSRIVQCHLLDFLCRCGAAHGSARSAHPELALRRHVSGTGQLYAQVPPQQHRRHPGQMDRLQRRKLERYPPSGGAMLYGLRLFDDSHQLSAGKSGFGLPDRASGSGKCHSHGLFLCLL